MVTATNLGFTLKVSSGAASEFLVDFSACPSELAPGASCPVTVGLTPQTLGQKQATFTATGNVGNVLSYSTCNITGTVGELISIYIEPFVFSLAAQSSPAGLNCNEGCNFTGGSSAYFAAGTVLTITVTGLATGMAVSWTPPCNNLPGGGCTFTVSADAQLVGTAAPALTVELTTAGAQVTVVDPGGQSCSGGTCGFIESGPVTLTVQSPEPFVIEAWGGACSGTSQTCSLNVTLAATVTLSVSPPNNIFLTGPVALSTIGADGAGADTACHQAALGNRDTQPYVAWVATSTRNPASLLAAGSGWAISGTYPGDYILTARTIADITGPRLVLAIPPALGRAIATGANPDGTTLGMTETCQDWTSPSGTAPAGTSGGVGYAWSVDIGAPTLPCSASAMLACFGQGVVGNLVLPPITPPIALTFTSSPWVPAGGLSGADSHCQADAADAGLSGTFAAASLHSPGGTQPGTSVRTDGLVSSDPQNVDARGQGMVPATLSDTYVWVEKASSDCNGWTGGPGAVGSIVRYDHGSTNSRSPNGLMQRGAPTWLRTGAAVSRGPRLFSAPVAILLVFAGCGQTSGPFLSLPPSPLDFGRVPGPTSAPMSIQLINTGGSAAEGISVAIGGGGPSAFSVSAPGCVPSLAAGASCNISVQVTAQSPGGQQATLEVQSSNGGDAPYLILQAQVGWKVGLFVSAAAATLTVTPPIPLWSCSGYCGDSSCTGQECSGSVFDGTPEQFSLSLPSGEGVQWTSPPCGYFPSPMCSFTVNADKAVNAQVGPLVNLNVTRQGFANDLPYGLVALGPPGVVSTDWCVGTCPFVWFGPLMLDAVLQSGEDPDSAVLLQWGDACADAGPSCQLDVDAGLTVTANFQPVNSVFTTGPLPLASFGSDGSGADSACNTAASSKGYGGTFVAWLASTGRNPAQLLAGSNGWGGVSGNASPIFAPDIQALAGARPWAPLISTSTPTVTGAAVDGTPLPASETCNNWTSTTGVTPAGTTGAMGYAWSNDLGAPPVACSGSADIVCFGTGASGPR